MRHFLLLLVAAPLVIAADRDGNEQAVRAVLTSIGAGETLPEEILDRQVGYHDLPDLDEALTKANGCVVRVVEPLQNSSFGVQWRCKGRKRKDMPSALMIYVAGGKVTRITTAMVM